MGNEAAGQADLQFDTVVPQGGAAAALRCGYCARPIGAEYYDVSGRTTCGTCHATIGTLMQTPRGAGPLLMAALFGAGAGIAGAIIYYAVIAITKFEIGIVAILIGYMVGYAVRKGAGGRGGRRFQVLAVALTYTAVGLAYVPMAVSVASKGGTAVTTAKASPSSESADDGGASAPSLVKFIVVVIGLVFALPVIVVVGNLPGGVISAAIMFFGMRQAWRMTGTPPLVISGPFRVGDRPAAAAS